MISRGGRVLVSGVVVGVLASAGSASAHVDGGGPQPVSEAPDLRSVAVVSAALGDGQPEVVRYCFDVAVAPGAGTAYTVSTYDVTRSLRGSGTPTSDPGDARCARVAFVDGSDVTQATIGVAAPGAATRAGSTLSSVEASEPLGGSVSSPVAGRTTAPDLIDVTVSPAAVAGGSGGSVTYVFDEDIDPALPASVGATDPPTSRASLFFLAGSNGALTAGSAFVGITSDRRRVTIGFNVDVTAGRVFVANTGAVRDRPQSTAVSPLSLTTDSPITVLPLGTVSPVQLRSATPVGGTSFQLTYSGPAAPDGISAQVYAVTDDGRSVPGSADTQGADGTVVTTFATLTDPDGVVAIVDRGNGATGTAGAASAPGRAAVRTANAAPGYTSAPDLVSAGYDRAGNQVTYVYDEPVTTAGAAGFFALLPGGGTLDAGTAAIAGSTVRATFTDAAAASIGAGTHASTTAAPADPAGHRAPASSVGFPVPAVMVPAVPVDRAPPTVGRLTASAKTVTVTSSEAGTARVTITKKVAGRKVRGTCVKAKPSYAARPACKRPVVVSTSTATLTAGTTQVPLRKLAAGTYLVSVVALDTAGNAAAPVTATLKVRSTGGGKSGKRRR